MKFTLDIARKIAGLTQKEAATAIGVSRTTIQSWEAYRTSPTVDYVDLICSTYGLDQDQIIFSKNN